MLFCNWASFVLLRCIYGWYYPVLWWKGCPATVVCAVLWYTVCSSSCFVCAARCITKYLVDAVLFYDIYRASACIAFNALYGAYKTYHAADDIVSWCRRYCIMMQMILYRDADDIVSWCRRYCIVMQTILYHDADDIVSWCRRYCIWCRRYCIVMQTILYHGADDTISLHRKS